MSYKEKAEELYEKFFYTIPSMSDEGQLEHEISKKCAIISVIEVINAITFDFENPSENTIYWYKVKQEIQKRDDSKGTN